MNANEYLSEDKRIIHLPVPFGSTVYEASLGCCKVCTCRAYGPLNVQNNSVETFACKESAPCYTKLYRPIAKILNLANIERILGYWGTRVFADDTDALAAAKRIALSNHDRMTAMGYAIDRRAGSLILPDLVSSQIQGEGIE
jgi:hypothetical protein